MEEFATQDSVSAVEPGSAPVENALTEAVNTSESAPEEAVEHAEETIEVEGAKPSKAVRELIEQRKKRQQREHHQRAGHTDKLHGKEDGAHHPPGADARREFGMIAQMAGRAQADLPLHRAMVEQMCRKAAGGRSAR